MRMLFIAALAVVIAGTVMVVQSQTPTRWVKIVTDFEECAAEKRRACSRLEFRVELGLNSDGSIAGWRPAR